MRISCLLLFVFYAMFSMAQSDADRALDLATHGQEELEAGHLDSAIALFSAARTLDDETYQ